MSANLPNNTNISHQGAAKFCNPTATTGLADLLTADVVKDLEEVRNQDPLSKFEELRITERTPIPEPQAVITCNYEIISTPADITAISGPSKSGKSAFTMPVISAAITVDGIIDDPIEGVAVAANQERKAVIHLDTEQARWKHQRNIKAILKRARLEASPPHFLSYNIRQLTIQEYERTTLDICDIANQQFGGIFLIVVDGIADFIEDVNDAAQGNAIIKTFEKLAIDYNCPIIVIIHNNPNSDKERGHLGSQLQRKAGSVLAIKKDGDISFLEPRFLRYAGNGSIPAIQFRYDAEKGYHVSCGTKTAEEQVSKDIKRIAALKEIALEALPVPSAFKYQEAVENIMKVTHKRERTAKDTFKEMRAHQFIVQSGDLWRVNIDAVQ